MSTLKVINVIHPSGSTNNLVTDSSGNVTAGGTVAMASSFLRNRIINGDMRIDQRNAGAAITINSTTAAYGVDRWRFKGESTDGVFTVQQSTTAPTGYTNSTLITVTTADASLGASQHYIFNQFIEGFNVADFGFGAAGASTITLSFWVRSSVTGTFGGSLQNSAENRSYPFTYTINAANTFEQKTITVTGDTTGTWVTNNGIGLRVTWGLGVGSTLSGTAGAWAAADYRSATGATNLMATLNATMYITGVQLEVGSVATPFERRLYGQELALCYRYYYRLNAGGAYTRFGMGGVAGSSTAGQANVINPVTMRVSATAIEYSNIAFYDLAALNSATLTLDSPATGPNSTVVSVTTTGMTTYRPAFILSNNTTSSYFAATAEL